MINFKSSALRSEFLLKEDILTNAVIVDNLKVSETYNMSGLE